MCSMLVRLERIMLMWALIILLEPSTSICLYLWHSWIEAARAQPYMFHARLVPRLTYGMHLIKVASRVHVSPTIVDMTSTTEGP
jgi:hypothetical protein